MKLDYLVTDPDMEWSVAVTLDSDDVLTVNTRETTPQIVQICRDAIESSVRQALDEQFGALYGATESIDVEKLAYEPIL